MPGPQVGPCPAHHVAYGSEQVASNALTLHTMANPTCPGVHAFVCADHFHIGHVEVGAGKRCKAANPPRRPRPPMR